MATDKTKTTHDKEENNNFASPTQQSKNYFRTHHLAASSILLNIILDSNDAREGPVVQFGMNAAFACPVQKQAEAAGSNPARSTISLSLTQIKN